MTTSHICFKTCTGCGSLNAFNFDWPYKFTVVDINWRLCISPMICTGLMTRKHSNDYDLAPVKGEPDYAPLATGHLELQPRACGTVFRPLSLLPAHSVFQETTENFSVPELNFLSFSFILIVYRVLEAFSLNASLIFTLIIISNRLRKSVSDGGQGGICRVGGRVLVTGVGDPERLWVGHLITLTGMRLWGEYHLTAIIA